MNFLEKWIWLELDDILYIHQEQIKLFGGLDGIRDIHIIESAVNRPKNLFLYTKPDIADLSSSYAFAIARYHGFIDGNKRTAWVSTRIFLLSNGYNLYFEQKDAEKTIIQLAQGNLSEENFAKWIRSNIKKSPPCIWVTSEG